MAWYQTMILKFLVTLAFQTTLNDGLNQSIRSIYAVYFKQTSIDNYL